MLSFDLSDEHTLFRSTVREFAEGSIQPQAEALDREGRFPVELVREAAGLGLLGIPIPADSGGAGSDTLAYAIAIEQLARVDQSFAITVAAHTSLGTMPIHLFGSDQQRTRWLPRLAAGSPAVTARVHDERWLRSRGMGLFSAVAQGSSRGARLIELHYKPARPARRDVVLGLVGKGITFDSGGLSIKPARSMVGMKYDMSGAAAVLEATAAIAELGLPVRVVTIAGATENLLDTAAYKVDDILTAANGKTVEITNTDAEGRLVLADCLHHARGLGATHLVDIATLTGAVRVALGDLHAGVMGNDQEFIDQLLEAGEQSGEHLWQLPLHKTFRRFIDSRVADMANASSLGLAGPSYAARFLEEFAGDGPWAHLDIAGTADLERSRGDEMAKGGTGFGVRLFVELAERLC